MSHLDKLNSVQRYCSAANNKRKITYLDNNNKLGGMPTAATSSAIAIPNPIAGRAQSVAISASSPDEIASGSLETVNASEIPNRSPVTRDAPTISHMCQTTNGNRSESPPVEPITLIPGENIQHSCSTFHGKISVTNYRIVIVTSNGRGCNIPLPAIESIDTRDFSGLQISCKDGRVFRISSSNSLDLFKKLASLTCGLRRIDEVFAFKFYEAVANDPFSLTWLHNQDCSNNYVHAEFERLKFSNRWKVSDANARFELCDSYPPLLFVPTILSDEQLKKACDGRFLQRLPTAVWRCARNGALLLRSSQPRVGIFSWRNEFDERIVQQAISETKCQNGSIDGRMLIMDARSYTAAWANRAKGGGFESAGIVLKQGVKVSLEYYQGTEVQFMGLPNIHNIRYSFGQLRNLLSTPQNDPNNFLQGLQTTQWFLYLSTLLAASVRCVEALFVEGRSVLVHCSDGWDRTAQIVSLAKLIADPYYRTIQGFEELNRREWIEFGHKFADRTALLNSDSNERSPVFLQWLDCVYQLMQQFPCAFEFNQLYLVKLAQHSFSGLFNTFLWNNPREAMQSPLVNKAFSIWSYLNKNNRQFANVVYEKYDHRLKPNVMVQHVQLWRAMYTCSVCEDAVNETDEARNRANVSIYSADAVPIELNKSMNRAHSCESLSSADLAQSPPTTMLHHSSNSRLTCMANINGTCPMESASAGSSAAVHRCPSYNMTDNKFGSEHPHLKRDKSTSMSELLTQRSDINSTEENKLPVRSSNAIANGRRKFHLVDMVDDDGLTRFDDPVQSNMQTTVERLQEEVELLKSRLRQLESENAKNKRQHDVHNNHSDHTLLNGHSRNRDSRSSIDDAGSDFCGRSLDSVTSDMSMITPQEAAQAPKKQGWMMDEAALCCTICRIDFGGLTRKHHCRLCGKVFCNKCCEHKIHSPDGGCGRMVRACNDCHARLSPAPVTLSTSNANCVSNSNKDKPASLESTCDGQAVVA